MSTETEQQIGPYILHEPIGFGAQATTYRASDPRLGRQVALKLVHPQLCATPAFAEHFRAEAGRVAGIHHQHLVPVFDAGETPDGSLYLALQLLDGTSLDARLRQQGPLPFAEVVQLATQLAPVLDHLRDLGIAYGSVRPANVMVGAGGRATLLDFSVRRALAAAAASSDGSTVDADHVSMRRSVQTVELDPVTGESSAGGPSAPSGGSSSPDGDAVMLARLCFELLAGQPVAPEQETAGGAMAALRARNPALPEAVAAVIERALAGRPEQRPASAGAFAQALRVAAGDSGAPSTGAWAIPPDAQLAAPPLQAAPPAPASAPSQPMASAAPAVPAPAAPATGAYPVSGAPRSHGRILLASIAGAVLVILALLAVVAVAIAPRQSRSRPVSGLSPAPSRTTVPSPPQASVSAPSPLPAATAPSSLEAPIRAAPAPPAAGAPVAPGAERPGAAAPAAGAPPPPAPITPRPLPAATPPGAIGAAPPGAATAAAAAAPQAPAAGSNQDLPAAIALTAWAVLVVFALAAAAIVATRLRKGQTRPAGASPTATLARTDDRTLPAQGRIPGQPAETGNRRIGPFRLVKMLGCGGFASVYEAEDEQSGGHVALKLLHPHLTFNETIKGRFRGEAKLMTRLHHPHIVAVYGEGETADGTTYLAMELLYGTLLSEVIGQQAPLPLDRTASVVSQLASALDYLHESRIVHRDLKPSNVMVDGAGNVTLMDFGIARILDDEAHLTRTGELVGTPIYMAPEQISGEMVSGATDIYALGILTYELCAGRPPFVGRTPAVIRDQLDTPPPPIVQFNPTLPAPIAEAIEGALAKDPSKRPASAAAFALRLGGDAATAAASKR